MGKLSPTADYRLYEVNWSPDTMAGASLAEMLKWSCRVLFTAFRKNPNDWLLWPQVRLARLRMAASAPGLKPRTRHALAILSSGYRKYRGSLGTRHRSESNTKSSMSDFLLFAKRQADRATTEEDLSIAASAWSGSRLPCEIRVRSIGRSLLVGVVATLAAMLCLPTAFLYSHPEQTKTTLVALLLTFPFVAGSMLFSSFISTVFSDVKYWSALDENDPKHETRRKIENRAISTLQHILADPCCGRVVIVSHSLGTAIAYDALRKIGLYNDARLRDPDKWIQIKKVDCLITLGSPIDKLTLLFETSPAKTFREDVLREGLRGNMINAPFWAGDRQRIKWINFWDEQDPVSDPLHIPVGVKPIGDNFIPTAIENIKVTNSRLYRPALSHIGYMSNPAVFSRIYDEIFRPESKVELKSVDAPFTRKASKTFLMIIFVVFVGLVGGVYSSALLGSSSILHTFICIAALLATACLVGLTIYGALRARKAWLRRSKKVPEAAPVEDEIPF